VSACRAHSFLQGRLLVSLFSFEGTSAGNVSKASGFMKV